MTKSFIEDLPSSDVQTIVLPSDELNPVDSQVFVKKPKNIVKTDTNYNDKAIDKNKVEKMEKLLKIKAKYIRLLYYISWFLR